MKRWTGREVDLIEELRLEGWTLTAIAEELHVTRGQVRHVVKWNELVRICPREERWIELLGKDLRDGEIALRMGVDVRTVAQARYRLRRKRRYAGLPSAIHHMSGRRRADEH